MEYLPPRRGPSPHSKCSALCRRTHTAAGSLCPSQMLPPALLSVSCQDACQSCIISLGSQIHPFHMHEQHSRRARCFHGNLSFDTGHRQQVRHSAFVVLAACRTSVQAVKRPRVPCLSSQTCSTRSSTEQVRSCRPLPGVSFSSGLGADRLMDHVVLPFAFPGGTPPVSFTALTT